MEWPEMTPAQKRSFLFGDLWAAGVILLLFIVVSVVVGSPLPVLVALAFLSLLLGVFYVICWVDITASRSRYKRYRQYHGKHDPAREKPTTPEGTEETREPPRALAVSPELACRGHSDPEFRRWIDEQYRRATGVPIGTEKPPPPPATSGRDELASPKHEQLPERPVLTQRPLRKRVKGLLEFLAGLAFIVLLFLIGGAARYGVVWLTGKLYPLAEGIATFATVVLVFVLLPSALFKRNREWCGIGVVYVSYAWGVTMWMWATLVLYGLWGKLGIVLGFVVGPGSVPLACVALLFSGRFKLLGEILLGVAVVFATRFFGIWFSSEAERN